MDTVTFNSEDLSLEGTYVWSSIGVTWYVVEPDADLEFLEESLAIADALNQEQIAENYSDYFGVEEPIVDLGYIAEIDAYFFMEEFV